MLKIRVIRDGPLYFDTPFTYIDERGVSRKYDGAPLSLCRCGRMSRAPFCDQSHSSFPFTTDDHLNVEYKVSHENSVSLEEPSLVKAIEDGPLYISGSVSIVDESHVSWEGNRVKLCRCGYSQIKPFCDGAHKSVY
ncbi:MAG: CDGSH iron-sulfur domain-containing protein, partial [Proteobacteria bacterium]|nr:CDGSH iron-sulfur domain-containing protein [Pseudomonadota bacterium]